jgi:hypothetical protein
MVVAEDPPVPRDSRTEVYAMDMIQKAKRMYMGDYLFLGYCLMDEFEKCMNFSMLIIVAGTVAELAGLACGTGVFANQARPRVFQLAEREVHALAREAARRGELVLG